MLKLSKFFIILFVIAQLLVFNTFVKTAFSESLENAFHPQDQSPSEDVAPDPKNSLKESTIESDSRDFKSLDKSKESALRERIDFEKQIHKKPFVVSLHRPNYFLGATYNRNPNKELYKSVGRDEPEHYEAKFQLSARILVWPEIFLSFDTDFNFLGLTNRLFTFGGNHQSNGMGPDTGLKNIRK